MEIGISAPINLVSMSVETHCEESRLMELFRAKWALSVLAELDDGDRRFNELKRALGDVPANTLSKRLTELEDQELITRTVEDSNPPRVNYALSPRGDELMETIYRIDEL